MAQSHCQLLAGLARPPGVPAGSCGGTLSRIAPDGTPIGWDAPAIADDAQGNEGRPGEACEVRLYRCGACGATVVEASGKGGRRWLRNEWATKVGARKGVRRADG